MLYNFKWMAEAIAFCACETRKSKNNIRCTLSVFFFQQETVGQLKSESCYIFKARTCRESECHFCFLLYIEISVEIFAPRYLVDRTDQRNWWVWKGTTIGPSAMSITYQNNSSIWWMWQSFFHYFYRRNYIRKLE